MTMAARVPRNSESGFSLMEVIIATVIATVAVVGLAYTFGMGRGFINRFEVGRIALAAAESRVETIASLNAADPSITPEIAHTAPLIAGGRTLGSERWLIDWVDDPGDQSAPQDLNPRDLRRATVTVTFQQPGAGTDSVRLVRYLPAL